MYGVVVYQTVLDDDTGIVGGQTVEHYSEIFCGGFYLHIDPARSPPDPPIYLVTLP